MLCADVDSCYKEITYYWNSKISGLPFVVNIDDIEAWKQIFSKINTDSKITISAVSDFCNGDSLPALDKSIYFSSSDEYKVVVGVSQYNMFKGEAALKSSIAELVNMPVNGHTVVILSGCRNLLNSFLTNDPRLDHRVAILDKNNVVLPRIILVKSTNECIGTSTCANFKELMRSLETFSYPENGNTEITAITSYGTSVFKNSMYSISAGGGIYENICRQYSDISGMTEKSWGTDKEWNNLNQNLIKYKTLSGVIDAVIGGTSNLYTYIDDKFENMNSLEAWYLWLAMKSLGTKENSYLTFAVQKSVSPEDLIRNIYMEILCHKHSDLIFSQLYKERKRLIERLPEDISHIKNFCDHVGQYEKYSVYYLTDSTDIERLIFLKCLETYDYSESELHEICKAVAPEVYLYLYEFKFTAMNTPVPPNNDKMHDQLTEYFSKYKIQKLTNRIFPEFYDTVREYAVTRPYNKLLPRISIVKDIDKENSKVHFFDALGVEFLSYMLAKCEKYKLQAVTHIAHCDLPSITSINLDFKKYFNTENDEIGTKKLDELKHHSLTVDYRKCPEPIHLFEELDIIDKELRKIRAMLFNQETKKIIIVSDHGASRLAVINKSECDILELDSKGEHSGRCCPVSADPNIPEATYENNFSVLANYDRFKGGRKANVEVHGGATLEETVVPIIEVTLMPEKSEVCLVNSFISFHNKDIVAITIFSNIQITTPQIYIKEFDNKIYECAGSVDGKHYKFEIPDIKRSGHYTADLYDGDRLLIQGLKFETKKAMSTTKDFF